MATGRSSFAKRQRDMAKKAKAADIMAIEARILELQEAQKTAERDLADCELFSSYPGQVADVHVVPGSVVQPNQW